MLRLIITTSNFIYYEYKHIQYPNASIIITNILLKYNSFKLYTYGRIMIYEEKNYKDSFKYYNDYYSFIEF
jgi:hypothetical protein